MHFQTKLLNVSSSATNTDYIIKQNMYDTTNELGWKNNDLTLNSLHKPTRISVPSVHYIKNYMESVSID